MNRLDELEGRFLILRGANEEIVPPQSQRDVVAILSARDCTTAFYPDGWHWLLRDLQRETVFTDIIAWLDGEDELPSGFEEPCARTDPDAIEN